MNVPVVAGSLLVWQSNGESQQNEFVICWETCSGNERA